ncbi:MAG: potassium channel protein [Gemmatimonadota bacterium]|uniref:potassium channel family protein n=1 Tax=Candidatus Palauibacter scopulicola TaxID=3056741 RepID=UPI0023A0F21B|nr:potassium channel protein [Candidatus Palauibacter scopulicola]MDE2663200.1 potassium channel protein [Candidatus Palauibacter scopulicola]
MRRRGLTRRLFDFSRFEGRLFGAVLFTVSLTLIGTTGFALMPQYDLSDAFFMTVITVSAVGYGEIRALTDGGRIFASLMIAGGIITLAIWFALITATLLEMNLTQSFKRRRTMKRIDRRRDHVILCGAGRTGLAALNRLVTRGTPYVAIERDPAQIEEVRRIDADALVIEGDATDDDALVAAGIERARGLIASLSADTDNAFVCLAARELNPDLTIVGRARSEDAVSKLRKAGADRVVTPNSTGGIQMASLVLRPDLTLFVDFDTPGDAGGMGLLLEQVSVRESSEVAGLTLAEAEIHARTGLLVVAIRRGSGAGGDAEGFVYNPGPEVKVRAGDDLVVLGPPSSFDELRDFLS